MKTTQTQVLPATAVSATIESATTDSDLAKRAASGDEFAFECVMRRHNRLMFRTLAAS